MSNNVTGIYKITSEITQKFYIGSSITIGKRWTAHLWRLRNQKHGNRYLQNHVNKYGIEDLKFSVLEIIPSNPDGHTKEYIDALLEKEKYYIEKLKPEFNIAPVGYSPAGKKFDGSKYYVYNKKDDLYVTRYNIDGRAVYFGSYKQEADVIKRIEFLNGLSRDELFLERAKIEPKYYHYNKSLKAYAVRMEIDRKGISFNHFEKEEDAIKEVKFLKTLSKKELIEYSLKIREQTKQKQKGYRYNEKTKKYNVAISIDTKQYHLSSYIKEEDAIEKVKYLRTLSREKLYELIKIKADSKQPPKYYSINNKNGKYQVAYPVDGKNKKFGAYFTEKEAQEKVASLKVLYPLS
jgi:group I intron endonuclease